MNSRESISIVRAESGGDVTVIAPSPDDVIERVHAERKASTRRAYARALLDLAMFLGVTTPALAIALLIQVGPIEAHRRLFAWVAHMEALLLSAATRALRIAAVHAAWSMAQRLGLVVWPLRARVPRVTLTKDTRGPALDVIPLLLEQARAQNGIVALRDVVILLLLVVVVLRRAEIVSPNVEAFDRAGRRLLVRTKGHDDAQFVSLPADVARALEQYLDARGARDGEPLIANVDRRTRRAGVVRLCAGSVYRIVTELARRAGIDTKVSPQGLRHTGITLGLDVCNGDARRVRMYSRHVRLETILRYDDARLDRGGEVASLVAAKIASAQADTVSTNSPEIAPPDAGDNGRFRSQDPDSGDAR